jgi:hypothetical protein
MKIEEKEKTLVFILAAAAFVVFYVMVLLPSTLDNIKALQQENNELQAKIDEVEQMGNIIKDYKLLNMKVAAFLKGYFQNLDEEAIILSLDDMVNNADIRNTGINFVSYEPLEGREELANFPCLTITADLEGSAGSFLKLLEEIGKFNKKVMIKDLVMVTADNTTDFLEGQYGLQFLSISGAEGGESITSGTVLPGNKGKDNPFSSSSPVNNFLPNVDLAKMLLDQIKGGNSDFTLTAKAYDSDFPTVVLGLENDNNAESYVYANNEDVERVVIRLFQNDEGKYCFEYNTKEVRYPEMGEEAEVPFVTGNEQIKMKVYSDARQNAEDHSGAALSIYNETDLPFIIEVITDDNLNPRVEFFELQGNISVYDHQGILLQNGSGRVDYGTEGADSFDADEYEEVF